MGAMVSVFVLLQWGDGVTRSALSCRSQWWRSATCSGHSGSVQKHDCALRKSVTSAVYKLCMLCNCSFCTSLRIKISQALWSHDGVLSWRISKDENRIYLRKPFLLEILMCLVWYWRMHCFLWIKFKKGNLKQNLNERNSVWELNYICRILTRIKSCLGCRVTSWMVVES